MIIFSPFSEPHKRIIKRAGDAYYSYHGEHPDIVAKRNTETQKSRCRNWIYSRGMKAEPCIIHTDVGPVNYTPLPRWSGKAQLAELKKRVA